MENFTIKLRLKEGTSLMQNPDLKYQSISVIVPAHNEDATIAETIIRLSRLQKELPDMEIIVVDDGSTDNTQQKVQPFNNVVYIRHAKNKGKGAALATGIKASSGEVIVIQDADLEYPPEYIPELVKPILSGAADVVYGSRFRGKCEGMSFSHMMGNRILSLTARLLFAAPITDIMTGHKAFSRAVVDTFDLNEKGFEVEVEMTSQSLQNGWRFTEVPIVYSYRNYGVSKIVSLDGVKSLMKLVVSRLNSSQVSGQISK
jgi:glycosyltransferase involved in cell wall biosynthesis